MQLQLQRLQDYYPEILGGCLIVNTPWGFSQIYAICKSFLNEKTRERINIVGSNPFQEICKHVDEHNIPEFLGGKNKTPLILDHGPW